MVTPSKTTSISSPWIHTTGQLSSALRITVFPAPAPRMVRLFLIQMFSFQVPSPRQMTAPQGAASIACWMDSPGLTVTVQL